MGKGKCGMREYLVALVYGLVGGLVGSACTLSVVYGIRSSVTRIVASEIILVDSQGRQAATLSTNSDGAQLLLMDRKSNTAAVALGVESSAKYLEFFGKNADPVASLNSNPPLGASTLYLGDTSVPGRIALGADTSEGMNGGTPNSWLLQFKNPHNTYTSLFRVYVQPNRVTNEPYAFMQLNDTRTMQLPELPLSRSKK